MSNVLNILLIEDSCDDAELLQLALLADGLEICLNHVETHPQLQTALQGARPDVIICDGHLPGFDGLDALQWTREQWPGIPFFFCLGSLGDSPTDQLMQQAADGCVSKDNLEALTVLLRQLAH